MDSTLVTCVHLEWLNRNQPDRMPLFLLLFVNYVSGMMENGGDLDQNDESSFFITGVTITDRRKNYIQQKSKSMFGVVFDANNSIFPTISTFF